MTYSHDQAKSVDALIPYLKSDEKVKDEATRGFHFVYKLVDGEVTILKKRNKTITKPYRFKSVGMTRAEWEALPKNLERLGNWK